MVTHTQTQTRWMMLLAALVLTACTDSEPNSADDEFSDDESPAGANDDDSSDDDDDDDDNDSTGDDDDAPQGQRDGGDAAKDAGTARDAASSGRDAASAALDATSPGGGQRSDGGMVVRDAAMAPATGDAGAVASGNDVPAGEHCAPVAAWDVQAAQFEQQVLDLTNAARAVGHNCDSEGMFGAAPPLKMEARLRCSARLHSKYMAQTMEFSHTQSATGLDPFKRMQAAGYQFRLAGENIAYGQRTPEEVVNGWLESDGHCANMMNAKFTEIGVGYVVAAPAGGSGTRPGRANPYWTQNFGSPR